MSNVNLVKANFTKKLEFMGRSLNKNHPNLSLAIKAILDEIPKGTNASVADAHQEVLNMLKPIEEAAAVASAEAILKFYGKYCIEEQSSK